MKQKLILLILCIFCLCLLTGCGCEHEWADAASFRKFAVTPIAKSE